MTDPETRLLVRLPNWLGDIVMALPALGRVRAGHAGTLAVAVPAGLAPLAEALSGVDEVVPLLADRQVRGRAAAADVQRLRAGAFDRVILLTNSFSTAWILRRAGIPGRAGYAGQWRRILLTEPVSRRAARAADAETTSHHSRYYSRLVAALGFAGAAGPMRAIVPDWAEARARVLVAGDLAAAPPRPLRERDDVGRRQGGPTRDEDPGRADGPAHDDGPQREAVPPNDRGSHSTGEPGEAGSRPVLVVAPGAAFGRAKQYPPDMVAEVVAQVVAARAPRVVLVGSRGDREGAAAVESALTARTSRAADWLVNVAGRTTLAELMGIIALAHVVVSNDSGAMHVASALGTPVVVPFGPTDERATAPLGLHTLMTADVFCRPCHLRECPIDHRCMRRLDPAIMAAQVIEWLDRGGRP